MSTRHVAFVSRWRRTGRSTVVQLVKARQPLYRVVSVESPIIYMLNNLLQSADVPYDELYRSLYIDRRSPVSRLPGAPTTYALMRAMRVGFGRHVHPEFWARWLDRKLNETAQPALVDDVETKAELQMATLNDCVIVEVRRDGDHGAPASPDLDDYSPDWVIENNGDLRQLEADVANLTDWIKEGCP